MSIDFKQQAEEMILATGDRATQGRISVLAALLAEPQAVAHQALEAQLSQNDKLDRVTVYRVLDWLGEKGLVHKIMSGDRVARFRATSEKNLHQHAHFQCNRCSTVTCLDQFRASYKLPLPAGYLSQEVELTVRGLCAQCSE